MTRYTSSCLASHCHPLHQPIANHFRQFLYNAVYSYLAHLSQTEDTILFHLTACFGCLSIFPHYSPSFHITAQGAAHPLKVTQYSVMQTSHTLFINISVLSSMQICVILDSHQQCMDMPVFLQESLQFPDSHLFQTRPAGITGMQKWETKLKRCWGFVKVVFLGTDRISCQFRVDSG